MSVKNAPYYPFSEPSTDAKTSKGEKFGYLTAILYLSPATESGLTHKSGAPVNTCPFSTEGCRTSCLYTAGRAGIFPAVNAARRERTRDYVENRESFMAACRKSIGKLVRRAAKLNLIPCVRVNGTSDLPQLALALAAEFPEVQFYDYTKVPQPWKRTRANYHVTFSLSESNIADALDALEHGINVAVAFHVTRGHALPVSYMGREVIDGDVSDLRFKDSKQGVIVGLRAKGRARKDTSGFVKSATFVPLAALAASASASL
jgi:hypothetical protein